ncbi:hypothetical protein [Thiocystis violacea]|uniref:hypothetical protein n=1 Tax=Thiocystis violacea TaxID=13725 RepID=UPI0019087B37|nr:hypothetical protein [Thiocystis violacea]MBK1718466.1 hypothetical protein [Thiocystis violacea]
MNAETSLLRQIHPNFVQAGRVTSQAFRPTPKDEQRLSVDNGDQIHVKAAWERFVSDPACSSVGVMAVTHAECEVQSLPVIEDGVPYPEHCSIDFSAFEKREIERKAKHLSRQAQDRGWLFLASGAA